MSIKSYDWIPEYENISTERLRLFDVNVCAHFDNGIRIIEMEGMEQYDTRPKARIINIPSSLGILKNEQKARLLDEYCKFKDICLHEMYMTSLITVGGSLISTVYGVVFDKNGNVIADNTVVPTALSDMKEFFKHQIECAEEALKNLKNNSSDICSTFDLDSKYPEDWSDKYMEVYKRRRYLIIRFKYTGLLNAVIVFDTRRMECILSTTGAMIKDMSVIKTGCNAVENMTAIITGRETLVFSSMNDTIHRLYIEEVESLFRPDTEMQDFLITLTEQCVYLDVAVERELQKVFKKENCSRAYMY